jgi:hypothetical protein
MWKKWENADGRDPKKSVEINLYKDYFEPLLLFYSKGLPARIVYLAHRIISSIALPSGPFCEVAFTIYG